MTNSSSSTFEPRVGLQRTLQYRPHIRWLYYVYLYGGIILFLFLAFLAVTERGSLQDILFWIVCGPICMIVSAVKVLRPLAFTTVKVLPEGIELDHLGKVNFIPYKEITELKLRHAKNVAGWFFVKTKDKEYKFTAILERSEYVLESIAANRPQLISAKKFESYRRTAIICDHNCGFMFSLIKKPTDLLIKFVGVPALLTLITVPLRYFSPRGIGSTEKFLALFLTAMTYQIYLSAISFVILSAILMARTRSTLLKDPNNVRRDIAYEDKLVAISRVVQLAALLIPFALLCARIIK